MDWKPAIEGERAALKRIVALLLALADLAELAACRSAPVRMVVIWILSHGAAAARNMVAGGPDTSLAFNAFGPADAMRLAASLRALARQIDLRARLASAACRARCEGPALAACTTMPALPCRPAGPASLTGAALPIPHPVSAPDTS